jgi:hypothetical protein
MIFLGLGSGGDPSARSETEGDEGGGKYPLDPSPRKIQGCRQKVKRNATTPRPLTEKLMMWAPKKLNPWDFAD